MEILLRRASSLGKACAQAAQKIEQQFIMDGEIRFSAHVTKGDDQADIERQLHTASQKAMESLNDILDLYKAQSNIRALAGQANNAVVDPLLAERDIHVKKALAALIQFNSAGAGTAYGNAGPYKHDANDVAARLRGIAQRLTTVTTDRVVDSFSVSRLSDADRQTIADRIAELERRQRDISDEIARDNLNKKITLPPDVVKVLRKHKII